MTVKIKRMDSRAVLPKRATQGSAGYDLCALLDQDTLIYPESAN